MAYNIFLAGRPYPLTLKPLTHPDQKKTYDDIFNLINSMRNMLSERLVSAVESTKVSVNGTNRVDFTLQETLYLGEQIGFEIIYKTDTTATHDLKVFLNDDVTPGNYTAVINGVSNPDAIAANVGVAWAGTNRIYGVITPTPTVTMIDVTVPQTQGALTKSEGTVRCTTQNLLTPITKISFVSTSTFDTGSLFSIHRIVPWRLPPE